MTNEIVSSISERYKELYAKVSGQQLAIINYANLTERIEAAIVKAITN